MNPRLSKTNGDLIYNALTRSLHPRRVMKLSFDFLEKSAGAIRHLAPWPEVRLASQEFQNKLEAFKLFEYVDSVLQIPNDKEIRFRELVEQACSLESYRSVWVNEGLAHYFTEATRISAEPHAIFEQRTP